MTPGLAQPARRFARRLSCLAVLSLGSAVPAAEFDWPQWRGPNRDGVSAETNWMWQWPKAGPRVKWRASVGIGYSAVATSSGRVYTLGNRLNTDYLLCLDERNGQIAWQYSYPCDPTDYNGHDGPRATPTVDGKLVFSLSRLGHLLCVNADSGAIIWSRNVTTEYRGNIPLWGFACSPLVMGGLVIVETGADKSSLMAFNKLTGAPVWANGSDGAAYSSPMPFRLGTFDGVAMFSATGVTGRLAGTGQVLWTYSWRTQDGVNAATPVIFEDKVFISSGYNSGAALFRFWNGGAQRVWSNRNMRNHVSSCVRVGGHLFGFDEDQLRCLDLFTGLYKWTTPAYGKGALMAAGRHLIVLGEQGLLATVEASPWVFKEISRVQAVGGKSNWTPPVLSNGRLYVRSQDLLLCLEVPGN